MRLMHVAALAAIGACLGMTEPAGAQRPAGAAPADEYRGVPPASAYRGGAGSPFSARASNITRGNSRSNIAPRLPDPEAQSDDVRAYVLAARAAIAHHRTGAAQEALERAQTRALSRVTDPALAGRPDGSPISRALAEARLALAQNDLSRADAILVGVLDHLR